MRAIALPRDPKLIACLGTQTVQVSGQGLQLESPASTDVGHRMLENPSDESVVRWGNDGDSFVVLEVSCCPVGAVSK